MQVGGLIRRPAFHGSDVAEQRRTRSWTQAGFWGVIRRGSGSTSGLPTMHAEHNDTSRRRTQPTIVEHRPNVVAMPAPVLPFPAHAR